MERHGEVDDFRWVVERAVVVEEVYLRARAWLGPVKQEQAITAIEVYKTQTRVRGSATHCIRGHEYDRVYIGKNGPRKRGGACARITSRMERARRGIKPRRFKNLARRYNF